MDIAQGVGLRDLQDDEESIEAPPFSPLSETHVMFDEDQEDDEDVNFFDSAPASPIGSDPATDDPTPSAELSTLPLTTSTPTSRFSTLPSISASPLPSIPVACTRTADTWTGTSWRQY